MASILSGPHFVKLVVAEDRLCSLLVQVLVVIMQVKTYLETDICTLPGKNLLCQKKNLEFYLQNLD